MTKFSKQLCIFFSKISADLSKKNSENYRINSYYYLLKRTCQTNSKVPEEIIFKKTNK